MVLKTIEKIQLIWKANSVFEFCTSYAMILSECLYPCKVHGIKNRQHNNIIFPNCKRKTRQFSPLADCVKTAIVAPNQCNCIWNLKNLILVRCFLVEEWFAHHNQTHLHAHTKSTSFLSPGGEQRAVLWCVCVCI